VFFDAERFGFSRVLQANAQILRDEIARADPGLFRPWIEEELYSGAGWLVLPLFLDGPHPELERQCARNALALPLTTGLLRAQPGLVGAAVSCLLPGTTVHPHRGLERDVLRCHLGISVPPGAGIRFGSETRTWREGECLVFEDTRLHDAWNHGRRPRTVLLADFAKAAYA